MPNPLVPQGLLNRVKASVSWTEFPTYNITAPYLGRNGISLGFDGDATLFLKTLTGSVQSQEVTMDIMLSMHLLRTQPLGAEYQTKMLRDSRFGNGTVRPDVVSNGLQPWLIYNCGIKNIQPMVYNGTEEGYIVNIGGYVNINSQLFDV